MTTTSLVTATTAPLATKHNAMQQIAAMVLNTVSERSQRDYARALNGFMNWFVETKQPELNKAAINAHVAYLKGNGVTDSSINQRLAAIRKLANEAADNGLVNEGIAQAINRVQNIRVQGSKLGNWLSKEQAEEMLNAPNRKSLKGIRDRAILAVMIGCGLRREEIVTLTIEHVQQRAGRWVIVDLEGKHNRTRSIPMASWVKDLIDNWTSEADITGGMLFRRILKGGHLTDSSMTSQAIWDVVDAYSPIKGLSPHDLRRTFAKLSKEGGSTTEQIQLNLGHASVQTTERYLGTKLSLHDAPSDHIKLTISP